MAKSNKQVNGIGVLKEITVSKRKIDNQHNQETFNVSDEGKNKD